MQFPLRGEVCTSTFLVSPWGMWIELTCWSRSKEKGEIIAAQRVSMPDKFLGEHINSLPTPACLIDLDIVDHNVNLMASRIASKGLNWRIPVKAHKCPDLAKYIINKGAIGIVVLTLSEAELFAAAGVQDIYLANQVYTQNELERLSLVAKKIKRLIVAVDDPDYLRDLAKAVDRWEIKTPIEILIELNVNHNRCGTTVANAVTLAKLAREIELNTRSLVFLGITGYEGHTPILAPHDKTRETKISHDILRDAKSQIEQAGIKVDVVSGGGSCNYIDCLDMGVLTEIQAGGGALCDVLYYHKANLKNHGHKMGIFVISQIISAPQDKSRATANAGFKAVGWHPFGGLPELRDQKDLRVVGLSAEHTRLEGIDLDRSTTDSLVRGSANVNRGDKIVLIPGYTDAMGLFHRKMYGIRNDHVKEVWQTVSGSSWND